MELHWATGNRGKTCCQAPLSGRMYFAWYKDLLILQVVGQISSFGLWLCGATRAKGCGKLCHQSCGPMDWGCQGEMRAATRSTSNLVSDAWGHIAFCCHVRAHKFGRSYRSYTWYSDIKCHRKLRIDTMNSAFWQNCYCIHTLKGAFGHFWHLNISCLIWEKNDFSILRSFVIHWL